MASLSWEQVTFGGDATRFRHCMTAILAKEGADWVIFLVTSNSDRRQVTRRRFPTSPKWMIRRRNRSTTFKRESTFLISATAHTGFRDLGEPFGTVARSIRNRRTKQHRRIIS